MHPRASPSGPDRSIDGRRGAGRAAPFRHGETFAALATKESMIFDRLVPLTADRRRSSAHFAVAARRDPWWQPETPTLHRTTPVGSCSSSAQLLGPSRARGPLATCIRFIPIRKLGKYLSRAWKGRSVSLRRGHSSAPQSVSRRFRPVAFPNPVNEKAARVVAGGVDLLAVSHRLDRSPWLYVLLAVGFAARGRRARGSAARTAGDAGHRTAVGSSPPRAGTAEALRSAID